MKYKYLIPKEKFELLSSEEKIEFLLSHKIFIRKKVEEIDSASYFRGERYRDPLPVFRANNKANIKVLNEIIANYESEKDKYENIESEIKKINNELKISLDDNHRIELLKEKHQTLLDELISKEIEIPIDNFKNIKEILEDKSNFDLIVDYITLPSIIYSNYSGFSEYIIIEKNNKTLKFIKEKLNSLNFNYTEEDDIYIDSEFKKNVHKILFMEKIGLFSFLIDKYDLEIDNTINVNKLSKIINAFSGINIGTLNTSIQAMYNLEYNQKNNPKKEKNIREVDALMIKLDIE